jgi:hypothetical protein
MKKVAVTTELKKSLNEVTKGKFKYSVVFSDPRKDNVVSVKFAKGYRDWGKMISEQNTKRVIASMESKGFKFKQVTTKMERTDFPGIRFKFYNKETN